MVDLVNLVMAVILVNVAILVKLVNLLNLVLLMNLVNLVDLVILVNRCENMIFGILKSPPFQINLQSLEATQVGYISH